jgi:hypothetical protein
MNSERKNEILRVVGGTIERQKRQLESSLDRQVTDFDLLPRDLYAIASLLGLKVKSEEELESSTSLASETLGAFDRERKEILIAAGKRHTRQRFTFAHELGHYLLHNHMKSYRERFPASEVGVPVRKPEIELEADFFAAQLVKPDHLVLRIFDNYFGGPIDGTVANDDIAFFLSQVPHRKFSASEIVRLGKHERAKLFARIGTYRGVHFKPMCEVFDVSIEAMANSLKDLELVK